MAPSDQGPSPANFIIYPYLPKGEVHVFAGSSGAGKTTLIMQLLHDKRFDWGRVLYVATDRRTAAYNRMFERLGPLGPHVRLISVIDAHTDWKRKQRAKTHGLTTWKLDLDWLEAQMDHEDTVILDPAPPLLNVKSLNDMKQVAQVMTDLASWTTLVETTTVGVMHTNKTKRNEDYFNVLNRVSGSHGLLGYASTKALLLGADENATPNQAGNPCLVVEGQNFARAEVQLEQDAKGLFKARNSLTLPPPALLAHLPPDGSAIAPGALQALSGLSEPTVRRQLEELVARGFVIKIAHGLYAVVRPS